MNSPTPAQTLRDFVCAADDILRRCLDALYEPPQRERLQAIRTRVVRDILSPELLEDAAVHVRCLQRLNDFAATEAGGCEYSSWEKLDSARVLLSESGLLWPQHGSRRARLLWGNFDILLGGGMDGTEHIWMMFSTDDGTCCRVAPPAARDSGHSG